MTLGHESGYRRVSISLGARALPLVCGALEHATEHPDHDPILTVATVDGELRSYWTCTGLADDALPGTCAKGGDWP